ncbi:MAG: type II toxin-antitoxin system VapC family toxin [Dehalococcoidia bacterium]
MRYLIDSDHVIDHLAELPIVTRLLDRLSQDGMAISMITYMEIYEGVLRAPDPSHARASLDRFLVGVPILPFSPEVARTCASLRQRLRRERKRVNSRALDLLNAATAIHHGLIFVTRNIDDYSDIRDRNYSPSQCRAS